jgi:microcompartment protein CcmK/EutM
VLLGTCGGDGGRHPGTKLEGLKLLTWSKSSTSGSADQAYVVAVDSVGAGVGERVLTPAAARPARRR